MGNTFGRAFRVTTFGESHGGGLGCVIDGCPPGLALSAEDLQPDLERRRPGQSRLTTSRQESDAVEILSGVFDGVTLGTPIAMLIRNQDARAQDYESLRDTFRPSHADFTYEAKYGLRNWQGGGRASARETAGRVAAGAVARKLLREACGTEIVGYVTRIHDLVASVDPLTVSLADVEANLVRCPDAAVAQTMIAAIDAARTAGDSLGGVVECVARRVPAGWGEPVFDKLDADLAKAMISLPAAKGFEIGSGFGGLSLTGSAHNDAYVIKESRIGTETNRSGGIQGGISDGEPILLRVAFKPTATVRKPQRTVTRDLQETVIESRGRHDPCVVPRAVPIVEAMTALVLVDHWLRHRGQTGRDGSAL